MCLQMKAFSEDTEECRHVLLLRYFGETLASGRCGSKCDNCLRRGGQRVDPDWPTQVTWPTMRVLFAMLSGCM